MSCTRRLDLFGRELIAVDGTRIKAVNNKDRNFTRNSLEKFIDAADKKLEDYLNRLDTSDMEESGTDSSRVKNLAEKIEALKKRRGEYAAHLTDLEKKIAAPVRLELSVHRRHGLTKFRPGLRPRIKSGAGSGPKG